MKKLILFALFAALVMPQSLQADIVIAGLDTWSSPLTPTVDITATDVTATATASATGNWVTGENGSRGSSKDTTWGTFADPAPATSVTTGTDQNLTLTNGKTDGEVTLTITNNGALDLVLNNFHFDVVAFRPNAARAYALNVLAGSDITVGNVFTSPDDAITHLGGGLLTDDLDPLTHDQHDDIDLLLTGLADNTLSTGESAMIQIAFSSGTGSGGGHHLFLDNVAVSGIAVAVPEPSSLAMLGLAGMAMFVRRRK